MVARRALCAAALAAVVAPASLQALAPAASRAAAPLSVQEILARNAAARGGVGAWQKISSMAWAGRAETGANPARQLPFLLEQKRPNKMRFEIMAEGLRSVRAFDGTEGWKMKADPSSGRPQSQSYSPEELAFARTAQVIDGPLMDYAARGAAISLAGEGEVEGHRAYVLDVKLPSGGGQRVWVDAVSFLELRHDRAVHGSPGGVGVVTVLFREYREFAGLKLPTVIESSAEPGRGAGRLVIERVALNPVIDEAAFMRPPTPMSRRRGIVVDTRSAGRPAGTDSAAP